jgi:threonine dehydrogenase-like Zn-dependent dehydrogenase
MMSDKMMAQVVKAPYQMEYCEVLIPQINEDEVLVKVKVCGICGSDWSIYTGGYASEKLPMITGHEFWGVAAKVGKNVKGVSEGDRLAVDICLTCGTCYFCRRDDGLLCETFTQLGIHTDGGFAEYVKAPGKNCYLIPDSLDDWAAAYIEPLTAVIHAAQRMDACIGGSVAVIGTGLGVLHGALAKARACAPVIVIGTNPVRLEIAKQMGADFIIDSNKTPDTVAEVLRLTGGIGVDYVIESVGSTKTYEDAFRMLRRGGKLEAFGIVPPGQTAKLEPYEFVLGEKKVSGSCAGIGNNWGDAIKLLQYGVIDPKPMYSMAVPLSELKKALFELHGGEGIEKNRSLMKIFVCPELKERFFF